MSLNEYEERLQVGEYTRTLYCSLNGNNHDGLSWETAFNSIEDTINFAEDYKKTLILVDIGTYEILDENYLTIQNKILHIKGSGRKLTIFTKSNGNHANDFIFFAYSTAPMILENCCIKKSAKHNGVYAGGHGSEFRNVLFDFRGITEDPYPYYAMKCNGDDSIMEDCEFIGNGWAYSNGMYIGGTENGMFKNIMIKNFAFGIFIESSNAHKNTFNNIDFARCIKRGIWFGTTTYDNIMKNSSFTDCLVGLYIESTVIKTSLIDCSFTLCGTNIDDSSSSTELAGIISSISNKIYPENLDGVELPNSGSIGVYGATTVIIPADAIEKPFKILAFTAAPSDDKKFILRLSADSGVTWFIHMFERRDGNNGELSRILILNDTVFRKGTEVSGSIMCETVDETCEIWLYYQEI